jgi:hypothetical protein
VNPLGRYRTEGLYTSIRRDVGVRNSVQAGQGDDLRQFAIDVRQLGYSLDGGAGERPGLELSERMLATVKLAEARMAGAESTPLVTAER